MNSPQLHSVADWWRIFVESSTDCAFILVDTNGGVAAWNPGAERLLGYKADEIIGKSAGVLFVPEDRERGEPERELETAFREGCAGDERWHLRKDGSRFRVSGTLTVLRDESSRVIGFAKVMRDITERELALRERMAMLREVHHRVKNNLQLIVSLMRLQTDRIDDPGLLGMFQKAQNRVRAIAAVHERLYSTEDFTTIHIGSYLEHLARDLHRGYDLVDRVALVVDTADLALGMDDAISLAIIANEVLCNAYEHAFPERRSGEVRVKLRYEGDGNRQGELEIADDGAGLPDLVTLEQNDSMGFDLIRLLTSQLGATAEVLPLTPGSLFRIRFPLRGE